MENETRFIFVAKPPSPLLSLSLHLQLKKQFIVIYCLYAIRGFSFSFFFSPSACSYVRLFYNTAVVTATAAAIFTNGHTTPYTTQ